MSAHIRSEVNFQLLGEDNTGHQKGYRIRIVQVDGDAHYFADKDGETAYDRALAFCRQEGLVPVDDDAMDKIRASL